MVRFGYYGFAAGLAFLLFSGCSGKAALVSFPGEIKVDGAPLTNAAINFYPVDDKGNIDPKGIAVGTSDSAGKFVMKTSGEGDGVFPGKYKVTVVAESAPPPNPNALPHESMKIPKKSRVDTDYNTVEKTPLTITIPGSSNVIEVRGPKK